MVKIVRVEADVLLLSECPKYGKAPEKVTGTAKTVPTVQKTTNVVKHVQQNYEGET